MYSHIFKGDGYQLEMKMFDCKVSVIVSEVLDFFFGTEWRKSLIMVNSIVKVIRKVMRPHHERFDKS
jgi:hypothetical protein